MKVIDWLNKIDNLKKLRVALETRVASDDVTKYDSDLMDRAVDAITEYIHDLYNKDVEV